MLNLKAKCSCGFEKSIPIYSIIQIESSLKHLQIEHDILKPCCRALLEFNFEGEEGTTLDTLGGNAEVIEITPKRLKLKTVSQIIYTIEI